MLNSMSLKVCGGSLCAEIHGYCGVADQASVLI